MDIEYSGSGKEGWPCLSPGPGLEPTVWPMPAAEGQASGPGWGTRGCARHGGSFTCSPQKQTREHTVGAREGREKITIDWAETTFQLKFCKLKFFKA